jgi:hypothetical protein
MVGYLISVRIALGSSSIKRGRPSGRKHMSHVDYLLVAALAPVIAYCFYWGIKIDRPSEPEFQNLAAFTTPEGFKGGYLPNYNEHDGGHGDYRLRYGLEVSEDGLVILEQSAISTGAIKTAFPY